MSELTPLQQDIKDAHEAHPNLDDHDLARLVFEKNHPDEEYKGTDPSKTYVKKMRNRFKFDAQPPNVEIETAPRYEPDTETDIEPDEKPIIPYIEEDDDEDDDEDYDGGFIDLSLPDPFEEVPITPKETEADKKKKAEAHKAEIDDIKFLVNAPFDGLANLSGWDGWRLDPKADDEQAFYRYTKRMLDRYAPELLYKYFLEILWTFTLVKLVGGRWKGYREWRKETIPPKKVESKVENVKPLEEETPEEATASEITEATEIETTPTMGEKALGEDSFKRRLGIP